MKNTVRILGTHITETSLSEVSSALVNDSSLRVAICNTNTVVRSYKNPELGNIINSFDIKTSDGFPIAKSSSILYKNNQRRVDGYNVLLSTIREGLSKNTSHYFFGSNKEVLSKLEIELKNMFPDINIKGSFSPPLGTPDELAKEVGITDIIKQEPDIIWVSLGFPKQELFIDLLHKNYTIKSNLVGVGAVFEWAAGTKKQAPLVLQKMGLEWLYRLLSEPKRLWRRYFYDFTYLVKIPFKKYLFKN